jgi:hypothetical protein
VDLGDTSSVRFLAKLRTLANRQPR